MKIEIDVSFLKNSNDFDLLKLSEEMSETNIEIMNYFTKKDPDKFSIELLCREMSDVFIRIAKLFQNFQNDDMMQVYVNEKIELLKERMQKYNEV